MAVPVIMGLVVFLSSTFAENSTTNETSLIKEDPIAESLEHDTMAFFAVLMMLCK